MLQFARRTCQAVTLAVLLLYPLLAFYAHHRRARGLDDAEGTWREPVFNAFDSTVGRAQNPDRLLGAFQGTMWSLRFAGVSISDPLAVLDAMAAGRRLLLPLLLTAAIPLGLELLFGRVFCAWLCPVGFLLEWTGKLRALLRLAELPERDVRFSRATKYLLLAAGTLLAVGAGLPFFALLHPPAVFSREVHILLSGGALTAGGFLLGVVALFELLVSRRGWCRYLCPGGALYAACGALRLVRVRRDPDACTRCGTCVRRCEMGLRPMIDQTGAECDNCGLCVSGCPTRALSFGLPVRRNES